MKKQILLLVILFSGTIALGQPSENLNEYKASNGVTYKVGENLKLGYGSGQNGDFVYLTMEGWGYGVSSVGSGNASTEATIKKIKKYSSEKRGTKVLFTLGAGNITNYSLDIEGAINSCEVADCKQNNEVSSTSVKQDRDKDFDKYEKLRQIKALFDDGALTKEEFQKEKNKILNPPKTKDPIFK